jgi:hypothetical protein
VDDTEKHVVAEIIDGARFQSNAQADHATTAGHGYQGATSFSSSQKASGGLIEIISDHDRSFPRPALLARLLVNLVSASSNSCRKRVANDLVPAQAIVPNAPKGLNKLGHGEIPPHSGQKTHAVSRS